MMEPIQPGEVTYFYRYQATTDMEKESYSTDLELLYEDLTELRRTKPNLSLKEAENALYWKYENTLTLRSTITGTDLFCFIYEATDSEVIIDYMETYKVAGLYGCFQEEIDEDYSLEELLEEDGLWACEDQTYLTLYEGHILSDEGERGVIFKPLKLLKYLKTNID